MENYLEHKETERLLIRPLTLEDIKPWTNFLSDPKATRYFTKYMKSSGTKQAESWINKQLERYKDNKYGLLALEEKGSGDLVGQCGLLSQIVDGKEEIEISYHLFPKYWGNGYASEAAKEFRNYCFQKNLSNSLISIIHIDNIRSQKVAKRNDMVKEKKTSFSNLDVFIFRITKEKWEQNDKKQAVSNDNK